MTSTSEERSEPAAAVLPSAAVIDAAQAALDEVAQPGTVGELFEAVTELKDVQTLRFRSLLPGYPDWAWTVVVSVLDELEPSILELSLIPGEGSLLAPDWVPWADRLADYLAHREEEDASANDDSSTGEPGDDDFDDLDEADLLGDESDPFSDDENRDDDEDVEDEDDQLDDDATFDGAEEASVERDHE